MIIGIGQDIVDIRRIEKAIDRQGERFKKRIFTLDEIAYSESRANKKLIISSYGKRFAAKEAFVKAIGTGFSCGIKWTDIEVTKLDNGQPFLNLYGEALNQMNKLSKNPNIHLSITDEYPIAGAFVVIDN